MADFKNLSQKLIVAPVGAVTANGLLRWNGTTGKLVKNSGVTIDDSDNLVVPTGSTLTAGSFIPTSSTVPTNGMYLSAANQVSISTNGAVKWTFTSGGSITNPSTSGVLLSASASSATVPTVIAHRGDTTCGLGGGISVPAIIVAGATVQSWTTGSTSVTGNLNVSGQITQTNNTGIFMNNNAAVFGLRAGSTTLSSPANASFQLGAADAAAPVVQTLGVQSVVAGTTDTAGAAWILAGSRGTGTGVGGSIIFQVAAASTTGSTQNALAAALTIAGSGLVTVANSLTVGGNVTTGASQLFQWNGRGQMTSPVAGSVQFGNIDVDTNAAMVAQINRSQGALVGGTADQAGKNWTFIPSPGKGTGAGGSFIFQTAPAGSTGTALNAPVTALTIDSTKLSTFAGPVRLPNYTVAGLPSASGSGVGATAFVTDGSTTVVLGLGLTVVGGGANKVPVYSDGTNWIVG